MKILVTGNLGYLGPVISAFLKRRFIPEPTIVGLDRGFFAGCVLHPSVIAEGSTNVQFFGDVRDREVSAAALSGVDAVIHLAAISNDPMGIEFEELTLDINYKRSVELARLAKELGARSFVFASSCSVYGAGGDEMRTEESAINPLTAYARSKVLAEESLCRMADRDFSVTCLRFATACGASPRLRLDLVLNDFVASAVKSQKIEILSNGQPWRPLIAVRDMARAIAWAIERREQAASEPFQLVNVGHNQWNYRVIELAQAVQSALDGVSISVNESAAPDKRSYRVSFDRFNRLAPAELRPQESLGGVVQGLVEALKLSPWVSADFRAGPFIRLNTLRALIQQGTLTRELRAVATS